jgi:dihydroflavonol-4-reductase
MGTMRALVTGATGMIGNAILRELVARGHKVRALVRDPLRAGSVLPEEVELVVGDIIEPSSLRSAFNGVEVLFHAAGTPEGWQRDPAAFDRINRSGAVNMLTAAAKAGVHRVVYTSTMDVFRPDENGVLREDQIDLDPKPTAYEQSKQNAMREVERFLADGLDVVQINPAATYGPAPFITGMAEFFAKLLRRQVPVLPPGGCALAYVDAVGYAHVEAMERGRIGEQYLLACGYASLRELAELTLEPLRRRVPPTGPKWLMGALAAASEPVARSLGVRPVIARSVLTFFDWQVRVDASKAQRELGYEPVPIPQGVQRTVTDLCAKIRC